MEFPLVFLVDLLYVFVKVVGKTSSILIFVLFGRDWLILKIIVNCNLLRGIHIRILVRIHALGTLRHHPHHRVLDLSVLKVAIVL